jgi:predicted DNA-binding transcriptional regulator
MAALRRGEKTRKTRQVRVLLVQHPFGLRESEMARELGWQRRTVNNYLHALRRRGLIYKEGVEWFTDD